jgi:hypothetical protein
MFFTAERLETLRVAKTPVRCAHVFGVILVRVLHVDGDRVLVAGVDDPLNAFEVARSDFESAAA